MKDYYRLNLRDAVMRMRAGKMSCSDYIASHIERIRALEQQISTWAWIDEERAIILARAVDTTPIDPSHILHGIPVGIKDVIDTKDIPTSMGSEIYRDRVPSTSAPIVASLSSAGALILGKTVTAELAFLAPGKTRNPWNHAHTPGGSSSGSAAAVAAGFSPAALGTQTNGSVIRPAAFCGVVGFKPTQGRVSNVGTLNYAPSLDQIGFFTRNVSDVSWLASAVLPLEPDLNPYKQPPRFAAIRSPVWSFVAPEQRTQFWQDINRLRLARAEVIETELPPLFNDAHQTHRRIMSYEAARYFDQVTPSQRLKLSVVLSKFIDEGNRVSIMQYENAKSLCIEMQQQLTHFLDSYDAIITPPANGEAPLTLENTGDPHFCTIWTLCGVPAISIPTGHSPNGLPLGLQIISKQTKDSKLLRIAKWCENLMEFENLFTKIKA